MYHALSDAMNHLILFQSSFHGSCSMMHTWPEPADTLDPTFHEPAGLNMSLGFQTGQALSQSRMLGKQTLWCGSQTNLVSIPHACLLPEHCLLNVLQLQQSSLPSMSLSLAGHDVFYPTPVPCCKRLGLAPCFHCTYNSTYSGDGCDAGVSLIGLMLLFIVVCSGFWKLCHSNSELQTAVTKLAAQVQILEQKLVCTLIEPVHSKKLIVNLQLTEFHGIPVISSMTIIVNISRLHCKCTRAMHEAEESLLQTSNAKSLQYKLFKSQLNDWTSSPNMLSVHYVHTVRHQTSLHRLLSSFAPVAHCYKLLAQSYCC